jgi:hypothetical protein
MNTIALPALTADSALGFLAAAGTLRLVAEELGDTNAQISWPSGAYSGAVLESSAFFSVDDLVAALFGLVSSMRGAKQLLPGVTGFPPADDGGGADPTSKLTIADGRGLAVSARSDEALSSWITAMVALVPPIDRKTKIAGTLEKSKFLKAGPGTVWVPRTLKGVLGAVDLVSIEQAFTGWRRQAGHMGAYLDHRADVEGATGQGNKAPPKQGVPGATFLALMGLPLFPVRSTGQFSVETVGWASGANYPKGFAWPVWAGPLSVASVRALLDHPAISGLVMRQEKRAVAGLGISAVFRSLRISAGNNDAALAPATRIWCEDG